MKWKNPHSESSWAPAFEWVKKTKEGDGNDLNVKSLGSWDLVPHKFKCELCAIRSKELEAEVFL